MIELDGETYLDYNEAATALNSTLQYIRELVYKKELSSRKIGYSNKKYIAQSLINQRLGTVTKNETLPIATPQPFPIQSQSVVALSEIRQGYAQLTETLTNGFNTTVQPLVKTAIDTDMENFFTVIGNMLEKILNRMYSMSKEQYHSDMTPEQFLRYMMQDIEMPTELKEALLTSTVEAINNAEKAISLKT